MKVLHFKPYKDVFGCIKYQTANESAAVAVAKQMGHTYNPEWGAAQYIINRRDIEALEQCGNVIRIL